jgi:Family of unknown function (DUF5335)
MRTKEIDSEQWPKFFDDFTYLHHGKRVNVETLDAGKAGVTSHVRHLPLVGVVAADPKTGTGGWIEIMAGDSAKTHSAHSVSNPAHVRVAEEDNGQVVALQIESSRGLVTLVRFEDTCEGMPAGFTIGMQ